MKKPEAVGVSLLAQVLVYALPDPVLISIDALNWMPPVDAAVALLADAKDAMPDVAPLVALTCNV